MKALGLDIGGTRVKCGIVDERGRILELRDAPTPLRHDEFRAAVSSLITGLVSDDLAGAGIGAKGLINSETTRVESLPGTLNFLEGTLLSELIPPPLRVAADNDARAAMAAELTWGAAKGCRNALMLTLGTGVGGAVVADGKLLGGANGAAGHVGHLTMDPRGPVCICGNHGCLETLFSARAIESEAIAAVRRGCASVLTQRFSTRPDALQCHDVFEAAAAGDPLALLIRARAIEMLGAAIAGLVHVLDPEVVILGGQISEAGAALFEPLAEEVRWRTRTMIQRAPPLAPPQVADRSGVAGAAALIFR